MILKRLCCGLLSLFLSAPLALPVSSHAAVRFSDTAGHWAERYINTAIKENIINGYPDGRFRPDRAVTRAEFASMLNQALGNNGMENISFRDVSRGDWYYNDVAKAMSAAYTAGYDDNTFRPDNPITRQEAAVMISRIVPACGEHGNLRSYPDRNRIADWAYESLEKVNGKGYIGSYDDGRIHPQDRLTRAQAAKIICEIIDQETIVKKNIVIDDDNSKISNKIYSNSVTVDEDLEDGSTSIENCIILGSLSVRGGGSDSISVSNSRVASASVKKEGDPVRLIAKGETVIVRLSAFEASILQTSGLKGGLFGSGFIDITVNSSAEVTLKGSFPRIDVIGSRARVELDSGTIDSLTVGGKFSHITAESGTTIKTVTVNAESYFHGDGAISHMYVNADDVTYETKPKRWTIARSADTPSKREGSYEDISFIPKNGATNVRTDTKITVTFGAKMEMEDGDDISDSDIEDFFTLRKDSSSGARVDFSADINSSKKVITIIPDHALSTNTKYYLILEGDSIRCEDGDTNEEKTISFTTGITAPLLNNFSVSPGNTSVTASATPNVSGRISAVVLPSGSAAPSAAQIAVGQNSSGWPALGYAKNENVSASTPVTLPAMGGLGSGVTYDVWAVLYSAGSGTYSSPVKQSITTTMPRISLNLLTVKPMLSGSARENRISFHASTYEYTAGFNSSITQVEVRADAEKNALITFTGTGLRTLSGSGSLSAVVDIASNPVLTVTVSVPGKTASSYKINLKSVNDTSLKELKIDGKLQSLGSSSFSHALASTKPVSVVLDIKSNDPYAVITTPIGAAVSIKTINSNSGSASFLLEFPEGSYPIAIEFNVASGSSSDPPYTVTFTRP